MSSLKELIRGLPVRSQGRLGRPGDLFNLMFIGSRGAVMEGLDRAGWHRIPGSILGSTAAGLMDLMTQGRLFDRFPPMNRYQAFGRPADMNFSMTVRPILSRHHFRLWRDPRTSQEKRTVWWGTANFDTGVRWRDFSHVPDPQIDRERDFIARTLTGNGIWDQELIDNPDSPLRISNDKGYESVTDGKVLVVQFESEGSVVKLLAGGQAPAANQ